MDDPKALVELAVGLARRAGALLLEGLPEPRETVGTKSSLTDMVTEMDRASEALILDGLRAARPDDAVVGEEGGRRSGKSGVRWLVDPLDGTTNYLYGQPMFAVSIAAEVAGTTLAGVVADPSHDEVFSAVRGGGARCNGQAVATSAKTDLATALVGTGFSYQPSRRAEQARLLVTILSQVRDIRRDGAASLDLCWVACGRLDAFYESGLQPWDFAAGALIASEAGATVTGGRTDDAPSTNLVVATAPGISTSFRRLLGEAESRGDG